MSADAPEIRQRFGLRLGGVNLLTPIDRPAQFIALAAVYPLPLAPRRVRGLTQVHGHPVTVLDAHPAAPTLLPALQRHAILVIGDPTEAPMAFLVDEAPRAVLIGPAPTGANPSLPADQTCAFAEVLVDPCFELDDPAAQPWWQVDFRQLFELLIHEGEHGLAPAPHGAADDGASVPRVHMTEAAEAGRVPSATTDPGVDVVRRDASGRKARTRSSGAARSDRPGPGRSSGTGQPPGRRRDGRRTRRKGGDGE